MSGMFPGVECARRRRLHQSNRVLDSPACPYGYSSSSRKSFFCLYTSNNSSPSMAYRDEMLGEIAREAKQRLNEKLGAQGRPDHKRNGNRQETSRTEVGDFPRVEFGLKNTGPEKFS